LHLAEARDGVENVVTMAHKPEAGFRSTAAWIMGRIASPALAPELTRMLKDESPQVRSTALRALIELRRAEAKAVEPEPVAAEFETGIDRATEDLAALAEGVEGVKRAEGVEGEGAPPKPP